MQKTSQSITIVLLTMSAIVLALGLAADDGKSFSLSKILIQNNIGCVKPQDDLKITEDTTLCPGKYRIDDKNELGVIRIEANGVTLNCNGAEIIGDGNGYGILLNHYDNVTITNCTISHYNYNIWLVQTSNSKIINNKLFYYHDKGICLGEGALGFSGENNIIKNNIIRYAGDNDTYAAIEVAYAKNTLIQNNIVGDISNSLNGYGIISWFSDYTKIINNAVYQYSYDGIVVDVCRGCKVLYNYVISSKYVNSGINLDGLDIGIFNCQVAHNYVENPNSIGVFLFNGQKNSLVYNNTIDVGGSALACHGGDSGDCIGVKMYNNTVTKCDSAIDLWNVTDSEFYNNVFRNCAHAFMLDGYVKNSIFYNNLFDVANKGRTANFASDVKFNTTKKCNRKNIVGGNCIGGNWWRNYSGFDTNGDGIGETKYKIKDGLYDYLPLTTNKILMENQKIEHN